MIAALNGWQTLQAFGGLLVGAVLIEEIAYRIHRRKRRHRSP